MKKKLDLPKSREEIPSSRTLSWEEYLEFVEEGLKLGFKREPRPLPDGKPFELR